MGKILTFNISYVDINHEDETVHIHDVKSGLKLAGAKFVGAPTKTVLDAKLTRTTQVVEWFPDSSYGGFKGDICYTGMDEKMCHDTAGFADSAGRTCHDYKSDGRCMDGALVRAGETVAQFANAHGVHAGHACCECGGGVSFRHSQTTTGCVNIHVERCQWYVQTEDTLIQVAARFATNWLQIWHFNPTIMHPDSALPPKTLINIGHLYEVEPNDAMAVLAERFGTSIKHLQMNNWDLAQMSNNMLPLHKSICVIPNSCVTAVNVQRDVAA